MMPPSTDILFSPRDSFSRQRAPAGLSVGGNLNVGSTAFFGMANEPLTVGGNLTNAAPDMEIVGSGPFKVGGTLTNQSGAVLRLGDARCFSPTCPPPGFLPNLGPIGGPATSAGAVINNGTLYSWSDITSSTFVNKGTGLFIGGGPTVGTLANGGMLSLGNACCSIAEAETAGISVGTATGRYGYSQSANGILDELLLGKSAYGTIDAIHNSSTAYPVDLNGTLDIMLRSGFVPAPGESFTIFTFSPGELSGTFSDVTWDSFDNGHGYFQVQYNNAGGDVVVTAEGQAVPEPGTLLLFAPALAWLFWATRKTALRR